MSEHCFDNTNKSDKVNTNISATLQRQKSDSRQTSERSTSTLDLLRSAASETSQPLDNSVSTPLSQQLGYDFSRVRVHSGSASAIAAESINARAYTLGNRIHLGDSVRNLDSQQRNHLLSHEAVHSVQQGGQDVAPNANLSISSPNDAAEREAEQIADSFSQQSASPSLGLRDQLRNTMPRQRIARSVAPQIQRDLKGKRSTVDGDFNLNLKTESHPGAKNGMSGTIKFKASESSPDSTKIRILQIVRDQNLDTGKEYVWTGDEADRNKIMTKAEKGVTPGFFVDRLHKNINQRTKASDPVASPYYIDDYGTGGGNADGSKKGKNITEASIWDYPGSSGNRRFTFETAAKADDTNYIYATLTWGFTIRDASKGKIENEHASASLFPSNTFGKAVSNFNEFYKNPGASTAP